MPGWPTVGRTDDQHLVEALRRADTTAPASLYDSYAERLADYAFSLLGDREAAAEAVHDALVAAQGRVERLREPGRLRAWLYALLRVRCAPGARARGGRQATAGPPPDAHDDPGERELAALVHEAMAELSLQEREVLELSLRHDLGTGEAGAVLGLSSRQVAARLGRARDHLENAAAAVVLAKVGRAHCPDLSAMVDCWEGPLTTVLRRRLSAHIGRCEVCVERRDRHVSAGRLLDLVPLAYPPLSLRRRVIETCVNPELREARAAVLAGSEHFDRAGFPVATPRRAGGRLWGGRGESGTSRDPAGSGDTARPGSPGVSGTRRGREEGRGGHRLGAGTPATGVPATATPASGVPASGVPVTQARRQGRADHDHPASGVSASGIPVTGDLFAGTPVAPAARPWPVPPDTEIWHAAPATETWHAGNDSGTDTGTDADLDDRAGAWAAGAWPDTTAGSGTARRSTGSPQAGGRRAAPAPVQRRRRGPRRGPLLLAAACVLAAAGAVVVLGGQNLTGGPPRDVQAAPGTAGAPGSRPAPVVTGPTPEPGPDPSEAGRQDPEEHADDRDDREQDDAPLPTTGPGTPTAAPRPSRAAPVRRSTAARPRPSRTATRRPATGRLAVSCPADIGQGAGRIRLAASGATVSWSATTSGGLNAQPSRGRLSAGTATVIWVTARDPSQSGAGRVAFRSAGGNAACAVTWESPDPEASDPPEDPEPEPMPTPSAEAESEVGTD
ncbi:sigma-70 family RNA polymerase sigma factor [Streptosporangium sp. DT93]|uniref:RNA polymerase sigma factor n=1 Tax=Streptosporangium sp. DT93 TaxID=3393428 RepID=UPI003CE9D655